MVSDIETGLLRVIFLLWGWKGEKRRNKQNDVNSHYHCVTRLREGSRFEFRTFSGLNLTSFLKQEHK